MKSLSIVIPFYNESPNLARIYRELRDVRTRALSAYGFEIILMDNHSSDDSFEIASQLAAKDPEVRVVRLSRNFGYQANILTGLLASKGDAVIQLDADGEDDPALIPELVTRWEAGYQVVYGVRRKRAENFFLTWQRKIFYRLLKSMASVPIPVDAGDFRLMDRKVVECLRQFKEANPYLRGIIAWAGFKQVGLPYDRRPRFDGQSKFSWFDYLRLAFDGVTSFSRKPLSIASFMGFALAGLSFCGAVFYIGLHFFHGTRLPGFTTLVLVQLFLAGVQLLSIGLLGTYVGRIFEDVKRRPLSLVEKTVEGARDEKSAKVRAA